jgi:hypothetical protein
MKQGRDSGCEQGSKGSWDVGRRRWPAFSACVHAWVSGGCEEDETDRASPRHSGSDERVGKLFSADELDPMRRGREGVDAHGRELGLVGRSAEGKVGFVAFLLSFYSEFLFILF